MAGVSLTGYELAVVIRLSPLPEDSDGLTLPPDMVWRPATKEEAWAVFSASDVPDLMVDDLVHGRPTALEVEVAGGFHVYIVLATRGLQELPDITAYL